MPTPHRFANRAPDTSHEYNTEDQPPDPVSAGACSLVGDLSSIGMAIADMPRQVVRSGQRGRKEGQGNATPLLEAAGKQSPAVGEKASKTDSSGEPLGVSSSAPPEAGQDKATSSRDALSSPNAGAANCRCLARGDVEQRQRAAKIDRRLSQPSSVGQSAAANILTTRFEPTRCQRRGCRRSRAERWARRVGGRQVAHEFLSGTGERV